MSIYKVPYKLEVWEEYYDSSTRTWKEKRSVCLGTHDMTYQGAAYDINFGENTNGEKTLSFSLVGNFKDIITGQTVHNYLVDFLYNEAKIKLQYDGEWYEFIVKGISESHQTQLAYNYTCKFLPVVELSKIGYDIQFSLDDTTGSAIQSAPEFIEKTLEKTDWRYLKAGSASCVSDLNIDLSEIKREIGYEGILVRGTRFHRFEIKDGKLEKTTSFVSKGTIVIPYSQREKKGDIFVGLLNNEYEVYDDLIDRYQLYIITNPFLKNLTPSNYQIEVPHKSAMSDFIYYNDAVETHNSIKQYCTRAHLEDGTRIYYRTITKVTEKGYFKTIDEQPVYRYIVDSYDIVGKTAIEFEYDKFYYTFDLSKGTMNGFLQEPHELKTGDTVDFYKKDKLGHVVINGDWSIVYPAALPKAAPNPDLKEVAGTPKDYYVLQRNANGTVDYIKYTGLLSFDLELKNSQEGYYEMDTQSYSKLSINNSFVYNTRQFFTVERDSIGNINKINILGYNNNFEEDSFYQEIARADGDTGVFYSFDTTEAKYYIDNEKGNYIKINFVNEESYEMYRTVEVSRSNCFNITQQVAETFNVWCRYIIEYEEDGRVAIGEDGRKKKWVTLTNTYGTINKIGFTYGLNTSSITRNINSDEIITKLYVDYSEGSAAADGYVAIQYAENNISGENTIYNFDYYVQKGILNKENLKIDLYKDEAKDYIPLEEFGKDYQTDSDFVDPDKEIADQYKGYLEGNLDGPGFLRHLGLLNKEYDRIYEAIMGNGEDNLVTLRKSYQTHKNAYSVAINTGEGSLSGSREEDIRLLEKYTQLEKDIDRKIRYYESVLSAIVKRKQEITKIFNQAYARFIQEGSWVSSSYTNHNDYYADALKVSQDGAKPKAEYNLTVVNLYALPEYKEFKYQIGDITWIEDTEYFGYNSNGTPYHEKVIITQINRVLDMPINDTFTIANYSNKFEDIFQTMAAQVQSYTFNEQTYQRASHISANGTLSNNIMTSTFTGNKDLTLMSNDNITQTDEGLIFRNPANRNKMLRITAGGIVISNDGGQSYSTGIYDGKINTSLLQSGQLNVEHIHVYSTGSPGAIIMNGDKFRMYSVDKDAYYEDGEPMYGKDFNINSLFREVVDIVKPDDGKLYYIKEGDNYISVNSSLGLDQTKTYYEYIGGSSSAAREIIMSPIEGFKIRSGNSDKVYFDTEGNLTLEGVIIAEGGEIGGFNIGTYSLETRESVTGVSCGVDRNGVPTNSEPGYCFWAGATDGYPDSAPFYVKTDGSVHASKISLDLGQDEGITSTIGGWEIGNNKLYKDEYTIASSGAISGTVGSSSKDNWRLLFKTNFGVDADGILYANNPKLYNGTYTGTFDGTVNGYCTSQQYEALEARVKALENA